MNKRKWIALLSVTLTAATDDGIRNNDKYINIRGEAEAGVWLLR